jgi:glutamyl/glutaminyl-tRNA synthetase
VIEMNAGMRTLREVEEKSRFFFVPDEAIVYPPDAIEKILLKGEKQGLQALRKVREVLAGVSDWTAHALEEDVKKFCESSALGLGKVAQPIRLAISGSTISPPIFASLELLGKEQSLRRIDQCLAKNADC